jgi:hypothetical protein
MKIRVSTPAGIQTFDSNLQAISILFEKDEAACVAQMNTYANRRFSSVPDTATPDQAIAAADFPEYPAGANYREWAQSSRRKEPR